MKKALLGIMAVIIISAMAGTASATIIWGYETWNDTTPADGQVDEWGTYNLDFVPDNVSAAPESLAVATIGSDEVWGKAYYGSGVSSDDIIGQYHYLYLETYDIQGDMKIAVSGSGDADFFDATPHLVAGDTGDPSVIYNPGPYVFDLSTWSPGVTHDNVSIQMIAEGGESQGFTVNRVFLTDDLGDTGLIPEPSSVALLSLGLFFGFMRIRRKNQK